MRDLNSLFYLAADLFSEKSGLRKLFQVLIERRQAKVSSRKWVPVNFIPTILENASCLDELVIHVHLFHGSYVSKTLDLVADFPKAALILVTSPFEDLLAELESRTSAPNLKTRQVSNVGRNFGAIVQVQNQLSNFEFVLHLHSKESHLMSRSRSAEWSRIFWKELASPNNVLRIVGALRSHKNISIAYPELTSVLPRDAYSWANNKILAQAIIPECDLAQKNDPIAFPAGGMFLSRTSLLLELIKNIGPADFPVEPMPLDGTIAHALERLLGVYSDCKGWNQLILTNSGLMTTDLSFIDFKGSWG